MMHDLPEKRLFDPQAAEREMERARSRTKARQWFRQAAALRTDLARWFVAKTIRACPITMASVLCDDGIEAWCPVDIEKKRAPRRHGRTLVRWPLFDGYLFVRIDEDPASIQGITSFKGIAGLLGRDGKPVPVSDKIVNELKLFSYLSPKERRLMCGAVRVGERVKLRRALFGGMMGEVVRTDDRNGLVDVEYEFFGRMVPVRGVGLDEIEVAE